MLASCAAWPARHAGLGSGAGLVRAWHTRSASSWRERAALDPVPSSCAASAGGAGPFRAPATIDAVQPGLTRCNSLAWVARSCPRACLVFACDTRLAASRGAWDAPDAVLAGRADSAELAGSRGRSRAPVPNLPSRAGLAVVACRVDARSCLELSGVAAGADSRACDICTHVITHNKGRSSIECLFTS